MNVRGEIDLRARAGQRVQRDTIAEADVRAKEPLRRDPGALDMARKNMHLVEHEHIDVSVRGTLVRRDLCRNGALSGLGVRPARRFHALEQQHGPRRAVLIDAQLVRTEIDDWPAFVVGDADVETHELEAGAEHRRGGLRRRLRQQRRRREQDRRQHPQMVHSPSGNTIVRSAPLIRHTPGLLGHAEHRPQSCGKRAALRRWCDLDDAVDGTVGGLDVSGGAIEHRE